MSKSCVGCKFLYKQDTGYSNYTVLDTTVSCALNKNANLPADEPYDWTEKEDSDNRGMTKDSRCERFSPGEQVHLDCDGENGPADCTQDEEVIEAICKDSGRDRNGYK